MIQFPEMEAAFVGGGIKSSNLGWEARMRENVGWLSDFVLGIILLGMKYRGEPSLRRNTNSVLDMLSLKCPLT